MRRFLFGTAVFALGCTTQTDFGTTDTGLPPVVVPAGELCETPDPSQIQVRTEPSMVVLAPGQRRTVRVIVDPDFCDYTTVSFTTGDANVVDAPNPATITYGQPSFEVTLTGKSAGTTKLTVAVPK